MQRKIILHIDMDAFFAAVEERENPQFKGKPIIIGADPKEGRGRGVVSTPSYSARKFGVKSAMPISKAYQFCPDAIFLPVNGRLYSQVSRNIFELLDSFGFELETAGLDEGYLDISRLGDWQKAQALGRQIKQAILTKEKLTCTIGIGPNKLIAKIASEQAKPDGLLAVKPEQALDFLAPLSVQVLPGVGPKTSFILQSMGVNRIGELRRLSKEKLKKLFGKQGEGMWQRARGIDERAVTPYTPAKSIGREHTFEKDTRDSQLIFEVFNRLAKEVWQEARAEGFAFRAVTVKCRFEGFETHSKAKTLPAECDNFELFKKTAAKLLLEFLTVCPKKIRLIGVRINRLAGLI